MKNLFLTTALVLVTSTSAYAFPGDVNESIQAASIVTEQGISLEMTGSFYQGDFQSLAKSTVTDSMYTGHGSSMMMSIRMYRY